MIGHFCFSSFNSNKTNLKPTDPNDSTAQLTGKEEHLFLFLN